MVDHYINKAMVKPAKDYTKEEITKLFRGRKDLNKADDTGWTPLQRATYFGNLRLMGRLLDRRVEVDGGITENMSPLMIAVMRGNSKVVQTLLEAGANPIEKNAAGQNAMLVAFRPNIREMLIKSEQEKAEKEKGQ